MTEASRIKNLHQKIKKTPLQSEKTWHIPIFLVNKDALGVIFCYSGQPMKTEDSL